MGPDNVEIQEEVFHTKQDVFEPKLLVAGIKPQTWRKIQENVRMCAHRRTILYFNYPQVKMKLPSDEGTTIKLRC